MRAVSCLSGNRNGLESLNACPPLRRKSAACRSAAPVPRALSLEPLPPVTTTVLTCHGNRHVTRKPEPNRGGLR